jgi:hypothetical protein
MNKKAWEVISNYESYDLLQKLYKVKHGIEPNKANAREMAACFIQGRRYYEAASSSDRAIKPLLLYYGIVSLCRGLVLFLSKGLRECSLGKSHGLSIQDWQTVLSKTPVNVADLKISVNSSGTFIELAKVTENKNLLRVNSSGVNRKNKLDPIIPNSIVTFGDILSRLPEIVGHLSLWMKPCWISVDINGKNAKVFRSQHVTEQLVIDIVGSTYCSLVPQDDTRYIVVNSPSGETSAIITDVVHDTYHGIGGLVFAQPYDSNIQISKICQYFCTSYILSMLVRYHPSFWMDFMHQRVNDVALPTIFSAMEKLENLFPQLIIDFLEEK